MRLSRRSVFGPLLLVAVLLGPSAQAAGAATASYAATLSASTSCLLTLVTSWKGVKVAAIDVGWYEVGYVNPTYPSLSPWVATSQWPSTSPNTGVKRGSTVTFTFGPIAADTVSHDWYALVTFRDAAGASLTQVTSNTLSVACVV